MYKNQIHINCDLGEGGEYDSQLMPFLSACNIACGGHAGDLESMTKTMLLAKQHKVQIGAHPSYPDIENFGRHSIKISELDLKNSVKDQILSLNKIAIKHGEKLSHIKPHGALYNDASKDKNIAEIVLQAIEESELNIPIYCPEKSWIFQLSKGKNPTFFEAFADRNYNPDLSLVSRSKPSALITQKEAVFKHLFEMFYKGKIHCENGEEIRINPDTFCLHSDTPNSVEILHFIVEKFQEINIKIAKE
tara:strand:- start:2927 stop:3670 length:744 start_codon:yes stop_codon:yes gene_type:complete